MRRIDMAWLQRFVITLLFLLPFVFPLVSHAELASLRAGFAQSAIWLSRSHVVAGDTVNIFTVLYNSSENSISGDVVIEVDGSSIGTRGFTLASGETQVVSLPWLAKVGSHSMSARMEKVLDSKMNTSAAISDKTTGSITVSIKAPPPPSQAVQVLSTLASVIESGIASSTPKVLSALASLYEKTESLRADAKTALEKQIADSAKTAASKSFPKQENFAGNSRTDSTGASSSAAQDSESLLSAAGRYAAAAGLAIVSSKALFYISLALVFLLIIQMVRVFLRERRNTRRNRFAGDS